MAELVISVKQGKLKGAIQESVLGSSYIAFRGIPFAAPPIGELRFKDPKPPSSWTGIRDASKNANVCAQCDDYSNFMFCGSEDCLYLNVYTESLKNLKPVMVFVHGGAFIGGTSNDSFRKPDYLISKGVVLVSLAYRLGAFGFLNLGHKEASGNQGLKDLIAGLKWVKDNITSFGGDSNNITVFGDSAGSVMAHYLCVSPAAKGLFQKAILHSGLLTNCWITQSGGTRFSFKLASALGFNSKDPVETVKFLRTVSARKIAETQRDLLTPEEQFIFVFPFLCCVDDFAENPVLPLPIDQLIHNDKDISMIVGHTSHEYTMFLRDLSARGLSLFDKWLDKHVIHLVPSKSPTEIDRLTKILKLHFFKDKPVDSTQIRNIIELMTEIYFNDSNRQFLEGRIKRKAASSYYYVYSYLGNQICLTDVLLSKRPLRAASHVDEMSYLFYLSLCKAYDPDVPAIGTKDRATIERLTRMWTNFAKTGNPTPAFDEYVTTTWLPVVNDLSYLNIGDDLEMMVDVPSGFLKNSDSYIDCRIDK